MLGTLLNGRYNLLQVLGSGGFGQTFVAEDTQADGARCVVKQFRPISQDETFLQVARRLFTSEVTVLRKLGGYDRLPTLLNDFEEDGQFYLVEELIEGRSLSEEMRLYGKFSEAQVVSLLRDVAEILAFVHQAHVIHRDIKPSNLIRRQRDHRLVLIDFGAVKELNTQIVSDREPTKLTVGIATEGYGPTEQLAGKPRFNSDLYALGMTAIQSLTGLHPSQLPTHQTTGEVMWRDFADPSPWLADILTKLVRYHFNDRFQSATDLLAALNRTVVLESTDVQQKVSPSAETVIPPSGWNTSSLHGDVTAALPSLEATHVGGRRWGRSAIAALGIGLAGLLSTGSVALMRHLGWLQPLELASFDRMVQLSPSVPDPRLVVVGITEADIQAQKRFPVSDAVIAQAIQQLQQYKPRAIGLDIIRDIPQEPGNAALRQALQARNVIAIINLEEPVTPAPPGVPPDRVGFNDVVLDADSTVRRNLFFADLPNDSQPFYSFALRLALLALAPQGIGLKPSASDPALAQLGPAILRPLNADAGGYQHLDDRGYQIMLQYRGWDAFQQVSLGDVLRGKIRPDQIRDRVVLIGTTAANAKDLFLTPYSPIAQGSPRLPGVLIHAHMVSQFLSLATGEKRPIGYWPLSIELMWLAGWAIAAASMTWFLAHRPWIWLPAVGLLLVGLGGSGYGLFCQSLWVPMAAPAIAIAIASIGLMPYRYSQHNPSQTRKIAG